MSIDTEIENIQVVRGERIPRPAWARYCLIDNGTLSFYQARPNIPGVREIEESSKFICFPEYEPGKPGVMRQVNA